MNHLLLLRTAWWDNRFGFGTLTDRRFVQAQGYKLILTFASPKKPHSYSASDLFLKIRMIEVFDYKHNSRVLTKRTRLLLSVTFAWFVCQPKKACTEITRDGTNMI
jgi:hypothetical protein